MKRSTIFTIGVVAACCVSFRVCASPSIDLAGQFVFRYAESEIDEEVHFRNRAVWSLGRLGFMTPLIPEDGEWVDNTFGRAEGSYATTDVDEGPVGFDYDFYRLRPRVGYVSPDGLFASFGAYRGSGDLEGGVNGALDADVTSSGAHLSVGKLWQNGFSIGATLLYGRWVLDADDTFFNWSADIDGEMWEANLGAGYQTGLLDGKLSYSSQLGVIGSWTSIEDDNRVDSNDLTQSRLTWENLFGFNFTDAWSAYGSVTLNQYVKTDAPPVFAPGADEVDHFYTKLRAGVDFNPVEDLSVSLGVDVPHSHKSVDLGDSVTVSLGVTLGF